MVDSAGRTDGADRGGEGRRAPSFAFAERVERFMLENSLLPEGGSVLVGLSGGADSVALLEVLLKLAPKHGYKVGAAHFNHGIRGGGAEEDELFCVGLCRDKGVPLYRETADVPSYARENGLSLETAGRLLRYGFLERARQKAGADAIAVAHHMDDNAESVLMHLMRGSGLAGLTGIKPKRGRLIRPLLCVRRAEIEAFLGNAGLSYRTDETNLLPEGSRNRVRLDVVPYVEKHLNPAVVPALCSMAELLSRDEEYLCAEARRSLEAARRADGFLREELAKLPYPIKTRAVRMALAEAGAQVDVERVHVEAVCGLLEARTGASLDLPRVSVRTSYGLIKFGRPEKPQPFETPLAVGTVRIPAGRFEVERLEGAVRFERDPFTAYMDADKLASFGEAPVIRTRREGDRIRPVGAPGRRKLKDFFIDRKVEREKRDAVPLIACGSEVLFAAGLAASEFVKVDENTTAVLRARFLAGGDDNNDTGGLA